jgi:DNA polymerase II small subunit
MKQYRCLLGSCLKLISHTTSLGDSLTSALRRNVLERLIKAGFQITPDSLDFLIGLESPIEIVNALVLENSPTNCPPVLSREFLESWIEKREVRDSQQQTVPLIDDEDTKVTIEEDSIPMDSEYGWSISIIKSPDSISVGSEGTVDDFNALFNSRFNLLRRIFQSRIDTQTAVSLEIAKTKREDTRRRRALSREGVRSRRPITQKVVGIVKNRNISKSGNVVIELEDIVKDREGTTTSADSIICVIPAGREGYTGQQLSEKATSILLDEVLCVSGYVDQDGRMIANDVIFPDIPTTRQAGRAKRDTYAVFLSDLHCGSREFMEEEFDSFISWLNGHDVESSDKGMVNRVRYVFIAGDLVDGVGVYPSQRSDLIIPDIYDQYDCIAKKIGKLPKHIKIICIPGNHDACRQALPRPPIPSEYAESLYNLGERIMLLGDPAHLIVEGVSILLTHGDSIDDLVTQLPGASYTEPASSMMSLLQKRHLAPIYGGKTELAPLSRDWMVIETPPDIVHFGHAHHNAVDKYRGVQIINSGTFQSQTDFMRKQGVVPTPGIVTIINLHNGQPELRVFADYASMEQTVAS